MSKNFLSIAISTASSTPRGYPGCSNVSSPLTPRRTPRHESFVRSNHESDRAQLLSPRYSKLSPKIKRQHQPERLKSPYRDQISWDSSTTTTPSGQTFFPCSPALLTPFLIQDVPHSASDDNKLGTFSAINIILGKTIGVGIYSVPSSIFTDVGSVGMALIAWILGAVISFCGLAVYLDLGTAMPKSGGEKVYLERIFRKPKYLTSCIFMAYVVLLGFSTPNCIVLGEYAMYALGVEQNRWNVRSVAVLAITAACTVHARAPRLGLCMINVLGVIKLMIILTIIIAGIAAVFSQNGLSKDHQSTTFSRNFTDVFASSSTQPYAYATALLKVLYCFRGYNTANQVLSEVRKPVKTLRTAAPVALFLVSGAYLLTNIAYLCAVEKSDIASSGVVVAGHFFRNVFGDFVGEHLLPILIILSAFGSIAATSFAQARVNQELAKEDLIPVSHFWASNWPWGTPATGLFLHWLVSVSVIIVPPPGEIYAFLVTLGAYPVSVISILVSAGLLYLQRSPREKWQSPAPAPTFAVVIFLLANIALVIVPWIPPVDGSRSDSRFPYYAYPAGGIIILASGAVYWTWWRRVKGLWMDLEDRIIRNALSQQELLDQSWKKEVTRIRS
ncbi:MAG: hypothetical protein MMC23_004857 [Stictis urceolatum]|nr:hypothetical protein [Stictis urceolata]